MSNTPPEDDYIPGYATREKGSPPPGVASAGGPKEASPPPVAAAFDDAPEMRTPWNARSGAIVLVAIVLGCLAITLLVVMFGGVGALVWH
jgi:hypothetical protein